jgi:phage gpG-like protein
MVNPVKGWPFDINIREFTRDVDLLNKNIFLLARRLGDMTEPLTKSVKDVIIPTIGYSFFSNGYGTWAPLNQEWKTYKLSVSQANYLTLQFTQKLYKQATRNSIWRISKTQADMSALDVRVPYAKYHQTGTRTMPKREFAALQTKDVNNIVVIFDDWLRKQMYSKDFWPYMHKEF